MIARLENQVDAESLMRAQIVAFLEEYCRGMTLRDVREWFVDAGLSDGTCADP